MIAQIFYFGFWAHILLPIFCHNLNYRQTIKILKVYSGTLNFSNKEPLRLKRLKIYIGYLKIPAS